MKKSSSHSSQFSKPAKRDSELESLLHSVHIVEIEKLAVGGEGVARLSFKDKLLVVFVDRVAPKETVEIKITSIEKNFLKAQVQKILKTSPFRRTPPCVYYENCGGCCWQHIEENEQIHQKENILIDLFQKFLPNIKYQLEPSVISEKNFNYRNRIQLKSQNGKFGYFQKHSHDIIDIDSCLIADEIISEQIPNLKKKLKPSPDLKKYELRLNQNNVFESYPIGDAGEGLAFSQVNNSVNLKLVKSVTALVVQKSPDFLTELYAGSGNFSFSFLENVKNLKLESVEMNPDLTSFAVKQMFQLNLQKRLFAFTANCNDFVQRRSLSNQFILLDPPRSGCSDIVLQKISQARPQNIVYISCHPVFLARDLKRLLEMQPTYQIVKVQLYDMFPQTDHFETLVHLSLK